MKPSEIYKENADNCAMLAEGEPSRESPAYKRYRRMEQAWRSLAFGRRAGMAGWRSATGWVGSGRRVGKAVWAIGSLCLDAFGFCSIGRRLANVAELVWRQPGGLWVRGPGDSRPALDRPNKTHGEREPRGRHWLPWMTESGSPSWSPRCCFWSASRPCS
jgi:hypothetical protein